MPKNKKAGFDWDAAPDENRGPQVAAFDWDSLPDEDEENDANLSLFTDIADPSHSVMERQQAAALQTYGGGPLYTKQQIEEGKKKEANGLLASVPVGSLLRAPTIVTRAGISNFAEPVFSNPYGGQSLAGNALAPVGGLLKSAASKTYGGIKNVLKDPDVQKRLFTQIFGTAGGAALTYGAARAAGLLGSGEPRR